MKSKNYGSLQNMRLNTESALRCFFLSIGFVLLAAVNCRGPTAIDDISRPPKVRPADKHLANIFKPLDGLWEGKFYVYVDERGQTEESSQPEEIDEQFLQKRPLKLELTIEVQQKYVSESPYFQRVSITDTYLDERSERQIIESFGVNKVQDGKMWCVVVKPNETVVHSGTLQGEKSIIWQRNIRAPLRREYFKETIVEDEYTIIGWGYYGDDDPNLSPRYWFYGKYERVIPLYREELR